MVETLREHNHAIPIVSGGGTGTCAMDAEMKVLKTDTATVTLNDLPGAGGITIETTNGMKIAITVSGIEITNGQGATVKLSGPQVSINNGALDVI